MNSGPITRWLAADHARLDITVRANSEETRKLLLESIERVAVQTARAAGIPENLLPIVEIDENGAPTTNNDAALAQRVRKAMVEEMGYGRRAGEVEALEGALNR